MFISPPPIIWPDEVVAEEYSIKRYLTVTPNDSFISQQNYLRNTAAGVAAKLAWNTTQGKAKIVVAVIDSGIDSTHPDLVDNLWHNVNEIPDNGIDDDTNGYIDDTAGWDFVDNDATPNPSIGVGPTVVTNHGTHVAGIIGATGNNNLGVSGVAWHVQLMSLRVFAADGSSDIAHITAAIHYAIANGANVINMSYAGRTPSRIEQAALEQAYAAGIVTVAAAGNDNLNLKVSPMYPACYKHVIGVGAINWHNTKTRASNFGKACVDISAPGYHIFSTITGGNFGNLSGTSMAAPQISGAAVLLLSQHKKLSPSKIRKMITASATPLSTTKLGAGKLNIAQALSVSNLHNP